jgi:hypothetical protein
MVKYFLILLIAFSSVANTMANFNADMPRPLRLLVEESQCILSGYVVKLYPQNQGNPWGSTIAQIAVLEKLQGSIAADTIEVIFNSNIVCPTPPRYTANTHVLAFFNRDKEGHYYTHALSYGVKTLTLSDIAIYKARILEMQQIAQLKNKTERYTQTVEWLVKCAEQPATRWEGGFELSLQSDFMVYYDKRYQDGFRKGLNEAQRERLKTALLATTDMRAEDLFLVDLVYDGNEEIINVFMLNGLKTQPPNDWLTGGFMRRLSYLSGTPEMKKLMANYGKLQFENNKATEINNCIVEFIKLVEKAVVPNS